MTTPDELRAQLDDVLTMASDMALCPDANRNIDLMGQAMVRDLAPFRDALSDDGQYVLVRRDEWEAMRPTPTPPGIERTCETCRYGPLGIGCGEHCLCTAEKPEWEPDPTAIRNEQEAE